MFVKPNLSKVSVSNGEDSLIFTGTDEDISNLYNKINSICSYLKRTANESTQPSSSSDLRVERTKTSLILRGNWEPLTLFFRSQKITVPQIDPHVEQAQQTNGR
jgi:hypothetical protein